MPTIGDRPTSQNWGQLLNLLTNEELEQYGQLARDQIAGEFGRLGVYVVLVMASLGLLAAAVWMFLEGNFGWTSFLALGIGVILLYWPYRSLMTCRLWNEHYRAVCGELERREGSNVECGS